MSDVTIETDDGYRLQVEAPNRVPPKVVYIQGRGYERDGATHSNDNPAVPGNSAGTQLWRYLRLG